MIQKNIPILLPEPEKSPSKAKQKGNIKRNNGLNKKKKNSTRKHAKLHNNRDSSKNNFTKPTRYDGVDSSTLTDFDISVNHMDSTGALFEDDNTSWLSLDSGNDRSRGNSFDIDDVFTSFDAGEVRMQYKLHREMMHRHTENIIRYSGYEELPNSAKVLEDSIGDGSSDFDITQLMDEKIPFSKSASKTLQDSNISRGNYSFDGQDPGLVVGQTRAASNSLSFTDSPAKSSNDISVVSKIDNDADDDLFDFLLDD